MYFDIKINYQETARFVFHSALARDHLHANPHDDYIDVGKLNCSNCHFHLRNSLKTIKKKRIHHWNWTSKRRPQRDMMFLLKRLISTNSKMGEAFIDVLIDSHIEKLIEETCIICKMQSCIEVL